MVLWGFTHLRGFESFGYSSGVYFFQSFTHLRGFESRFGPRALQLLFVLPTYVGLNLWLTSCRILMALVLPTYVGLNLWIPVVVCGTLWVLPTYVGLNLP